MNISHNQETNSIEIKDGLKTQHSLMKVVMVIHLFNVGLHLTEITKTGIGALEILWIIIGLVSLLILYIYFFKRTAVNLIPLEQIMNLEEKSIFGIKRFSLKLSNGKNRPLNEAKSQTDISNLKEILYKESI